MQEFKFDDYVIDITAWLEVADKVYPITSFNVNYGMNGIPTAICQLAVGKLISDAAKRTTPESPDIISPMDCIKDIRYNKKATLWMRCKKYVNGSNKEYTFPVMCGYTNGTGYTRQFNQAGITLSITHWLVDLDRTSATMELLTASSTSGFVNPCVSNTGDSEQSTTTIAGKTVFGARIDTVAEDIWKNGIKKMFLNVTKLGPDGVATTSGGTSPDNSVIPAPRRVLTTAEIKNSAGRAIIEGTLNFNKVGNVGFDKGSKSYPLKIINLNSPRILINIVNSIQASLTALNSSSLWAALAMLSGEYRFAVIPTPKNVQVVPHLSRCSGFYKPKGSAGKYTITADEYMFSDLTPIGLDRVLGGVMLYSAPAAGPGATDGTRYEPSMPLGPQGTYPAQETKRDPEDQVGFWRRVIAPVWMLPESTLLGSTNMPNNGNAGGGGSTDIPSSQNPDNASNDTGDTNIKEVDAKAYPLAKAWARTVYMDEKYEARRGTITGKLRFDIAPGTQVRIQLASTNLDNLNDVWIQGCVEQVVIQVDAQNKNASTSFVIKNYRSRFEEEKTTEKSLATHPLYDGELWVGEPLVEGVIL